MLYNPPEGRNTLLSESVDVISNDSTEKCFRCWSGRGIEYVRPISACILPVKFTIISRFSLWNVGT
jgi:hypothetical protein